MRGRTSRQQDDLPSPQPQEISTTLSMKSSRHLTRRFFLLTSVVWFGSTRLPAHSDGQLKVLFAQSELVVSGTISYALPITSGTIMWSLEKKVDEVFKGDPAMKGQQIRLQADLLPDSNARSWQPPADGGASHFKTGATRVLFLRSTGKSSPAWQVIPTSVPSDGSQTPDHAAQACALRQLQIEAWPFK